MLYLKQKVKIAPAKVESGTLDGPQIRVPYRYEDNAFSGCFSQLELQAYKDIEAWIVWKKSTDWWRSEEIRDKDEDEYDRQDAFSLQSFRRRKNSIFFHQDTKTKLDLNLKLSA